MKKVVVLVAVLMLGALSSSVASAAIIACGATTFTYAQWSTWNGANPVTGCEINDKIFENFNAQTAPTDTTVQFSSLLGTVTVNFQNGGVGAFVTDFSLSYTVRVDPLFDPFGNPNNQNFVYAINQVAAGMQISGSAVAVLSKTCSPVCSPAPSSTASGASTTNVIGNVANAQSVTITDNFDYTSGIVTNIANTIFEVNTTIPEPSTFVLFGGALVGLGLLRRKRRSA